MSLFTKPRIDLNSIQRHVTMLRRLFLLSSLLFIGWSSVIELIESSPPEAFGLKIAISLALLGVWTYTHFRRLSLLALEWIFVGCGVSALAFFLYMALNTSLMSVWITASALNIVGVLSFLNLLAPRIGFICAVIYLPMMIESAGLNHQHPAMSSEVIYINFFSAIFIGLYSSMQKHQIFVKTSEEEMYREKILSNLKDGVVLLDKEMRILSANIAAIKMLEKSWDTALGTQLFDLSWRLSDPGGKIIDVEIFKLIQQGTNGRGIAGFKIKAQSSSGRAFWFEIDTIPLDREDGEAAGDWLVRIQDTTEIQTAKTMIEDQQASLIVASRLSALGEMAAGIAHEINNPITVISGRTTIIESHLKKATLEPLEILRSLKVIQSNLARVSKIVSSMKLLSRQKVDDECELVSINGILQEVLEISSERLKLQGVKLLADIPLDIEIECHPGLIGQVLINLLNNSIDALQSFPVEQRWVEIVVTADEEYAYLTFTDSGKGIPPELSEKIMRPFFTSKEVGKGTGLGLSLIRSIAQSHHGSFELEPNHPNTRFLLKLPLWQAATVNLAS